ncbi:hypothetical protein [Sneathiella litorea]|uniref:Uncharacterized protein n=1 Tax=Sneathiella litorea TaxID=2606216 RepID=A0A6L8W8B7_9PROT|nr:hypothetical protein [Sneathiella litorea]MZR30909.1 hypothetical protein [Sneathiella litorea]
MNCKSNGARDVRDLPASHKPMDHLSASKTGDTPKSFKASQRAGPKNRLRKSRSRSREPSFHLILTEERQIRASEMIARGFHLRTAGLGMRTQSYNWQPSSKGNMEDWQVDVMRRFMRWAVAAQAAGILVSVVLDIIVFGKSCRTVDRERQKRNGFARAQLLKGVELYNRV